MYNRINLMVPTYNRIKKLATFIDSAIMKVSNRNNICFTFCVNKRDTKTKEYIQSFFSSFRNRPQYEILEEDLITPHLGKYFNQL